MDNRLRFPATRVDFDNDVGLSGQEHDNYPAAGQQARFDWLRLCLIGLLSNQSSEHPPTQFREGTLWFNLTDLTLRIRRGTEWAQLTDSIPVGELTLTEWITQTQQRLEGTAPDILFSGHTSITTNRIPIPQSLREQLPENATPLVWVNGLLLDPASTSIQGDIEVRLTSIMAVGDRFTVQIRRNSGDCDCLIDGGSF